MANDYLSDCCGFGMGPVFPTINVFVEERIQMTSSVAAIIMSTGSIAAIVNPLRGGSLIMFAVIAFMLQFVS